MNKRIEIDVLNPSYTREFANPMPFLVADHLSYFYNNENNDKLTIGKVGEYNRNLTLREFLDKVEAQLYCVWGDERYERLKVVLRNGYREVELTYHVRYNPTRFKVNGKNVYHGEIYYPDEESFFKEEDKKVAETERNLRKRLVGDPEYLKSVINDYQVLDMENMLRDLFYKEFNKYCPYVIAYDRIVGDNGFSVTKPSFKGEYIESFEWNDDEEAKDIPELYLLETIEVGDGEEVFDYKLNKVDRDFYSYLFA